MVSYKQNVSQHKQYFAELLLLYLRV